MIQASLNLKRFLLILGDALVFEFALLVTLLIRYGGIGVIQWNLHAWPFGLLTMLWIVTFYIVGLYDLKLGSDPLKLFRTYVEGMVANLGIAIAFFYLIPIFGIAPRANLFLHFAISLLLGYVWRLLFSKLILSHFSHGRVLFVGPAEEAKHVHALLQTSSLGMDLVAVLATLGEEDRSLSVRWTQDVAAFDDLLKQEKITTIVLGLRPDESPELRSALYRSLFTNVTLLDRAELEEATTGRIPLSYVNETWFLHHLHEAEKAGYEALKRVGDIGLAILFGIPTLATLPLIALLIKIVSPVGPIFIRQSRVGRDGKLFTLYKYRTMKAESAGGLSEKDGPRFTTDAKTDPRIYPLGRIFRRLRIDELPQVWNVLLGDLSFIGPRPERPEFVTPLIERMPYYNLRHLTRPGLTGWAQVSFLKPTASLDDNLKKLQYDLFYVKHRSILLDVAILLKTIGIVLRRQGT